MASHDDDKKQPKKYGPLTKNQWLVLLLVVLIMTAGGYWVYTHEPSRKPNASIQALSSPVALEQSAEVSKFRFY